MWYTKSGSHVLHLLVLMVPFLFEKIAFTIIYKCNVLIKAPQNQHFWMKMMASWFQIYFSFHVLQIPELLHVEQDDDFEDPHDCSSLLLEMLPNRKFQVYKVGQNSTTELMSILVPDRDR